MKSPFHRSNDRDAIIILLIVVVACVVLIPLLATDDNTAVSSGNNNSARKKEKQYFAQPVNKAELFTFDPNTADSTDLLRLGLQPWQVRSIYKYRSKGGFYRTKEQFAQLYGLTLEKYRELEPYIRIKPRVMAADVIKVPETSYKNNASGHRHTAYNADNNAYNNGGNPNTSKENNNNGNSNAYAPATSDNRPQYHKKPMIPKGSIDINTADTTELQRIPGIGPYFARRIVDLRKRKMMFTSLEELLVIKNFPESTFEYMTMSMNFPSIHINTMSLKELERHPLISYGQARDIVKYRKFRGKIKSATDLSNSPSFTKEALNKIAPFMVFD